MRNSQGIDSRVTREQVKAQRLQNAMMADQLARPTQDIQDFGNLQNIFAQQMQGMQQMQVDPVEKQQQDQEMMKNQLMTQLMPVLSQQSDTTGLSQELLRALGFESELGPKQNPYAIQESPEELAMKEKLMQALQQLQ